jgi:hypothetical protein
VDHAVDLIDAAAPSPGGVGVRMAVWAKANGDRRGGAVPLLPRPVDGRRAGGGNVDFPMTKTIRPNSTRRWFRTRATAHIVLATASVITFASVTFLAAGTASARFFSCRQQAVCIKSLKIQPGSTPASPQFDVVAHVQKHGSLNVVLGADVVAAGCNATGDDFSANDFYLEDVTQGWFAGQPGDCIGLTGSYGKKTADFTFGDWYDSGHNDPPYLIAPGDDITVTLFGFSKSLTWP